MWTGVTSARREGVAVGRAVSARGHCPLVLTLCTRAVASTTVSQCSYRAGQKGRILLYRAQHTILQVHSLRLNKTNDRVSTMSAAVLLGY